MKEDFLQYLWKFQQWTSLAMNTQDGRLVEVVAAGTQNFDAGPDFLNAKVRIGGTLWVGNVEIHITASDWFQHKHHLDRAYDNVILHVVFTGDKKIKNFHGEEIPCLEIANHFDYQSYRYYKSWLASPTYIPCEAQVQQVPQLLKMNAIQNAAIGRIQNKATHFIDNIQQTNGNIEAAFNRGLFAAFGMKVNALPFEQLSKSFDFSLVRKLWDAPLKLEALFLGQAGFLSEESTEYYVLKLKSEYDFLKHKYGLTPMPISAWKLFRLRPPNFPTIRVVQLAKIYCAQHALAQKIIETESLDELRDCFLAEIVSGFWLNHFTIEKESEPRTKRIGKSTIDVIIINAVVPFLFALATYNKDVSFKRKGFGLLEEMNAEKNTHVKKFEEMGFPVCNALESQGVLGLYGSFCKKIKCLNCKVGIFLLKNNGEDN